MGENLEGEKNTKKSAPLAVLTATVLTAMGVSGILYGVFYYMKKKGHITVKKNDLKLKDIKNS